MKLPRLAIFLILLVLTVLGLLRVRFNADVLDLMPAQLEEIHALRLYQHHFEGRDELVIALSAQGADRETLGEAAESLAATLREQPRLVRRVIWEAPWTSFSEEGAELLAYYWLNRPPEEFAELRERLDPQGGLDGTLQLAVQNLTASFSAGDIARAGYDPLGLTRFPGAGGSTPVERTGGDIFVSEDGSLRLLYVHKPRITESYEEGVSWLEAIRQAVEAWRIGNPEFANLEVGYTGNPAFVAEISQGMRHDMSNSIGITVAIISLLFWSIYRRFSPLLILVGVLLLILVMTLGIGGLILGKINAVSVGFAAILVGLTADYGLILYQEASRFPKRSAAELRRVVAPSILWAALTTASVFGALQLSSFRGISQLGALVALGTLLGAFIMLYVFLPVWVWRHRTWLKEHVPDRVHTLGRLTLKRRPALVLTAVLLGAAVVLLAVTGLPGVDGSADTLRPRHSQAFDTLDEVQQSLGKGRESVFLLIQGDTSAGVRREMGELQALLERLEAEGRIAGYSLPLNVWPNVENQRTNARQAVEVLKALPQIREVTLQTGFEPNALRLADEVFEQMAEMLEQPAPFWPDSPVSRWILEKVAVQKGQKSESYIALGLIYPRADSTRESLQAAFGDQEILMTNWRFLGPAVLESVKQDLSLLMAIMSVVLLTMLWFVFRRVSEMLLSLATLGTSCVLLLMFMKILGLQWNLMNLMAIPLMIGAGLDYSIHLQLALQRHDGNLRETFKGIGLALLLCGASTTTGFLSLTWATNNGLVTLGQVCALGITITAIVAVFLLPAWWQLVHPDETLD
jgi:predicted RND superfamily exporter protein